MLKRAMQCDAIRLNNGYSLTEVIVACGFASIVITAVATHAAQSHMTHSSIQHAASVEDDMRALQSTIARHLSKAGFIYSINSLSQVGLAPNEEPVFEITTDNYPSEPENSCVTFSYDKNKDGVVSQAQGEFFGYRLHNKAIEYRVAGNTCKQSGWFNLTDTRTTVATKFTVVRAHYSSWGSAYEIEIELHSNLDPTVVSARTFIVEVTNAYK